MEQGGGSATLIEPANPLRRPSQLVLNLIYAFQLSSHTSVRPRFVFTRCFQRLFSRLFPHSSELTRKLVPFNVVACLSPYLHQLTVNKLKDYVRRSSKG